MSLKTVKEPYLFRLYFATPQLSDLKSESSLLVELLPPDTILIHVLDVHGRVIQIDTIR